jgi:protein-S-isoprenylcysteine O-methyltransferase Ste14
VLELDDLEDRPLDVDVVAGLELVGRNDGESASSQDFSNAVQETGDRSVAPCRSVHRGDQRDGADHSTVLRRTGPYCERAMITVYLGVAALLGWVGFELAFRSPGEASSWHGDARDRVSTPLLLLAFVVAAILPGALSGATFGSTGRGAWAGVGLCVVGLVVRAWGMRTLGRSYTRTLRTASDQRLVTTGPYRWVRHPGYAGSIAVWVGAALAFHDWLAAVLVAILMLLAYGWRIRAEERMLLEHFGDVYRDYAAHTSRLLPGVY